MASSLFPAYGAVIIGYLLGSIVAAVPVARIFGLPDPRTYGSGNPGATNMLRSGDKRAALCVLLFDMGKGVLAVSIARLLALDSFWLLITSAAVFLGHIFPVFYRFRGGKGVAVLLGAVTVFNPFIGGIQIVIWLLIAKVWRISALAALVAAFLLPIGIWQQYGNLAMTLIGTGMTTLLFYRHRQNIAEFFARKK